MDVAFNFYHKPSQHQNQPSYPISTDRPATHHLMQHAIGFTLIELLITLAITTILVAIASPNLINFVKDTQYSVTVNKIAYDLAFARTEAIKRAKDVLLCKSIDGKICDSNAQWQDGWIIYVDQSKRDKQRSPDEPLLKVQQALGKPIRITFTSFNLKNSIVYRPSGVSDYSNGTFRFCTRDESYHKDLILSRTGRTYIKTIAGPVFNKNRSC